ncbi:MAG: ribonucleoside triphosphate reductase [Deltaproteobacteria bacterium]|jgi:ribonucleoside-triphosphate reductase|nr:ribonucleoside triphosphate reductase [Deltaproteobacteria bacterium]
MTTDLPIEELDEWLSVKGREAIKRDGSKAPFDTKKIVAALAKAGAATGEYDGKMAEALAKLCVLRAKREGLFVGREVNVETLQDLIENVLMESDYKATAKAYILYREQRGKVRAVKEAFTGLMSTYLGRKNWKVKENSNTFFSLQGMNGHIAGEISKRFWLQEIYPERIRRAHDEGDLHIHDLNLLSVYCVGWDLADLLKVGFKGVAANVESAPARHLRTALGQLYNFFYTLQGEASGAQAVSNFDTLLAPFVRYDGLNYEQLYQTMQEFIFNLNIPTRVGFQTPFTNISLDLTVPSYYKDVPVIIGGEPKNEVYGDFQAEMDLLNKVFAEVMMAGDAKGRIFTFPIPTYSVTKDFDWDNPVLDSVWKMTGRYGIPYFSNFVNSDMNPEDARSMCCRLRLDTKELRKRGGGLFGSNPLTGSVGVVTINLPRIGYEARNKKDFFDRLDDLVDISCESLVIKRKTIEKYTEEDLYPFSKFYLRDVKGRTGQYWSNHFSTVGVLGANEACRNFIKKDISTEEGRAFAVEILTRVRDRLAGWQEKTGLLFNLEATPAESTCYKLAMQDYERNKGVAFASDKFGEDGGPLPREKDFEPFYTNSTHLPVNSTNDLFEALEHQDPLQTLYTGGTVLHGFVGEHIPDVGVVKSLVKKIASNFKLPYFTLTPTFSVCPIDGYLNGEQPVCPKCGNETDVYSRVVGYYRPVSRWNDGKRKEYSIRTPYEGLDEKQDPPIAVNG